MATITVVGADSPRWRVVQGDIHGATPLSSDAIGCGALPKDVFYLGGVAGENSSVELTFAGSLVLYGAASRFGGPLVLQVDGVALKTVDEHDDTVQTMRCTSIAIWPPAGLDVVQGATHVLRATYAGDSEHQAFIVNATILGDIPGAADPTDTVVGPPPTLPYPQPPFFPTATTPTTASFAMSVSTSSSTVLPPSSTSAPNEISGSNNTSEAMLPVILTPVLVGVPLLSLAAFGLYHMWKRRRALRAPSAAFRAESRGVLWENEKDKAALSAQ